MLRKARIVLEDVPHHITQRGNNQQDVFFVDCCLSGDRARKLERGRKMDKNTEIGNCPLLNPQLSTNVGYLSIWCSRDVKRATIRV